MENNNSAVIKQKLDEMFKEKSESLLTKLTNDVEVLENIMDRFTDYYHVCNYFI